MSATRRNGLSLVSSNRPLLKIQVVLVHLVLNSSPAFSLGAHRYYFCIQYESIRSRD